MSQVKRYSMIGGLLMACLTLSSFSRSQAITSSSNQTQQGDNGQPIQALLNEVRQLRLAIQRSNLNTYHAQVTLERLRIQQQIVDRLNEKLGEVRERMAKVKIDQARLPERFPEIEIRLSQETDPAKRREIENEKKIFKFEAEQFAQIEAQGRETETMLNGQLQNEQAKLNELNERLDALQRELETEAKPQPNGKRQ